MINRLFPYFATIFIFFLYNNASAQDIFNYKNIQFHKVTIDNGLPHNHVRDIKQDKDGFIWFVTFRGLVRFDGKNCKIFNPPDIIPDMKKILIDEKNIFWIIAANHFFKFNPKTEFMENIKLKFPENLKNIAFDKNKRIWIFGLKSIAIFNTLNESFLIEVGENELNKLEIPLDYGFQIIDKDNNIWLSSSDGFHKLRKDQKNIQVTQFLSNLDKRITVPSRAALMLEDRNGNLYFTNNGLFVLKYRSNRFEYIDLFNGRWPNDDIEHNIFDIVDDSEGFIWISTEKYGIKKYDPKSLKVTDITYKPENYKNMFPTWVDFVKDNNKDIWFFFNNNVFAQYNTSSHHFIEYKHDPANLFSAPDDGLNTMSNMVYLDNAGVYWSKTTSEGCFYFSPNKTKFSILRAIPFVEKSLIANRVQGIFEDSHNCLWLGLPNQGINILDYNSKKIYKFTKASNKDFSFQQYNTCFEQESDDEFWIGTTPLIRCRFDRKKGTLDIIEEYRPADKPECAKSWLYINILKDSRGYTWFASPGKGVDCYIPANNNKNKGIFKNYIPDSKNPNNSLIGKEVWHIFEDNQHRMWFSTAGGISRLDKDLKTFTNFRPDENDKNSISHESTKQTFQDKKGRIWIATENGGLNQYIEKENRFIRYNNSTGYPFQNLFSVAEDKNQNLWMSSQNGIYRFNPETNEYIRFAKEDGMLGNDYLAGSFYHGKSGRFYYGGSKGVSYVYPDSIKISKFVPKIMFTSLKVFNKEVPIISNLDSVSDSIAYSLKKSISYLDTLILSYKQNVFSLQFAALDYASNTILYAYKLEGVNKDWIEMPLGQQSIDYTNLPHGDYNLMVKSTNSDLIWCNNVKTLKIIITPPFWKTWWFRILLIFITVSAFIGYYKYKTYKIKEQNKILERKVTERTHEVMQQKEEIQQQAEELEATNEELTAQSDALKTSNEELNQKNAEINSQKDELEKSFKISQVISEFGQRVTSTFDLESINEIVYGYILAIMPTDAFGIGLYNSKKNEIEYIGFIEEGNKIDNFTKSLNSENSLTAWCFNNQKVVFVNDLETEYSNYILALPKVSTKKHPKSIIHLPLSTNERKLGLIVVNSFQKNAYTNKDLIHLHALASYITIALDNAEAYKTVNAQKEKLLELDKFKEGLTGMIVHDLKNPLNAIMGISSMFQEDEMWLIVNSAGNQMLNLVLNILDVQKFENTDVKLNLTESTAFSLASEACKQVALLVRQKNLDLNLQIDPNIVVNSDQEIIIRVFVNILTNAIKYTHSGGKITIKSEGVIYTKDEIVNSNFLHPKIKKELNSSMPVCIITVSDTGQGIPEEKQYLVFEKFGR